MTHERARILWRGAGPDGGGAVVVRRLRRRVVFVVARAMTLYIH